MPVPYKSGSSYCTINAPHCTPHTAEVHKGLSTVLIASIAYAMEAACARSFNGQQLCCVWRAANKHAALS
jgi:hypothetical protein